MHAITHIAACEVASIVAAEIMGYFLHRLMHNGWIPWLSISHMQHHMVLYAPLSKQRPGPRYLDATTGKVAIGNIGLEWIIPSGVILAIFVPVLNFLRVSLADQARSVATILMWSFLMFSYLHDRMHIKDFWMERAPLLRKWFLQMRRLHDIHHHALNNHGLMDKNFGIGLSVFDWLFGTLSLNPTRFNHGGYSAAQDRFRNLQWQRKETLRKGSKTNQCW